VTSATYSRGPLWDVQLALGQDAERRLVRILAGPGEVVRIESKSEPGAQRFAYVETADRGHPSGIATTEADWWAVEVRGGRWVLIPARDLAALTRRALVRYGLRSGGAEGTTRGAIVPLRWLVEEDAP
jgi:hypothetical protein